MPAPVNKNKEESFVLEEPVKAEKEFGNTLTVKQFTKLDAHTIRRPSGRRNIT